jgi:hypothetical protein
MQVVVMGEPETWRATYTVNKLIVWDRQKDDRNQLSWKASETRG